MKAVKSNFIYTPSKDDFRVETNRYLLIENGKIIGFQDFFDGEYEDFTDYFMIPSFVNLHTHAPQFTNRGIGYDKELLPWLEDYTFPKEGFFEKEDFAKKYYAHFVNDLVQKGNLHAVIFGTIYNSSNRILVDLLKEKGIFAYIGKVNMIRNAPNYLTEIAKKSWQDTVEFVEKNSWTKKVKPIITPRFAPSVGDELLRKLGDYAVEKNIPVQSHLDENRNEIAWVKELFPKDDTYAEVYYNRNLLGQTKTVMAHCVYMTEKELDLFRDHEVYVAHCPTSNLNLSSGIAPIKKYLKEKIHVGLGTDVAGGNNESMMQCIVSAIQCSKMYRLYVNSKYEALTFSEAFYLATKGGGEFFGKVGSFEPGYDFNALLIDDSNVSVLPSMEWIERLQTFVYAGDDRNIIKRYVMGEKLE